MKTYIILLSRRTKHPHPVSHHLSHILVNAPPCRKLTTFFPPKQNLNRKRFSCPLFCQKKVLSLHPKSGPYLLTHPIYLVHLSIVKRINLHPKNLPYPRLWLTLQPIYLVHLSFVKRMAFLSKIASRPSPRRVNSLILRTLGDLVIVSPIT